MHIPCIILTLAHLPILPASFTRPPILLPTRASRLSRSMGPWAPGPMVQWGHGPSGIHLQACDQARMTRMINLVEPLNCCTYPARLYANLTPIR